MTIGKEIQTDDIYTAEEIGDRTWRICEGDFTNMYLLAGNEKALLIDFGCGSGNLREVVKQLTDLPVVGAVTHRHPDHVGAAGQFGAYYADPLDCTPTYDRLCSDMECRKFAERAGGTYRSPSVENAGILPLMDKTEFDLGGRTIVTEAAPGHTAGSRIFIDHDAKLMITGDALNPAMFLHLPGCISVREWYEGTGNIPDLMKRGYRAFYGHGDGRLTMDMVNRVREAGEALLQEAMRGILPEEETGIRSCGEHMGVFYHRDNILERKDWN